VENIKSFNENLETEGLLKDLKSMDLHKKFKDLSDKEQEEYLVLVRNIIGEDPMFCTRSWSAWNQGTMEAEDFSLVLDDVDYVYDKAEYLYDELLGRK